MNRIISPLEIGMQGAKVADLQAALRSFIDQDIMGTTRAQSTGLGREQTDKRYGDHTARLVRMFQEQHQLKSTGTVDEATARSMTFLLGERGLLDTLDRSRLYVVAGQVTTEDGPFVKDLPVRAFHENETGDAIRLGEDETDAEGRYTIRYELLPGIESVELRVCAMGPDGATLARSERLSQAKALETVNLVVPAFGYSTYRVTGQVRSRLNAGVPGLRILVVEKGVGGDLVLAGENEHDRIRTDVRGAFRASFTDSAFRRRGKTRPDLEVQVFAGDALADGPDPVVGRSAIRYGASPDETLDVLLDEAVASALRSEHETLTAAISQHYDGALGDLQESETRQDLTYLANKTGWDARAVAMAALAEGFAKDAADKGAGAIGPELFYALLRAGIPPDDAVLYRYSPQAIEAIWRKCIEQGVLSRRSAAQIAAAVADFRSIAVDKMLDTSPVSGRSKLKDMLALSLGDNREDHRTFAKLQMEHGSDYETFWRAVRDEFTPRFGVGIEQRLRFDGQLAYLTGNDAPLIAKLRDKLRSTDLLSLVERGYYRSKEWQELTTKDNAPRNETPAERYPTADSMAALVRVSYPTAVVADMVRTERTPLEEPTLSEDVQAFLMEHHKGFDIGRHPIGRYLADNELVVRPGIEREIRRIQGVYQLTQSHDAMNLLLGEGIGSAAGVLRYSRDAFLTAFGDALGQSQAKALYARARQVQNYALNIVVSYLTSLTSPGIGANSPGRYIDPSPSSGPTMEVLFGELDFCDCEHCRSVLSPAAYLVDLLLFCDTKPKDCDNKTEEQDTPLSVLLKRRPDIERLPLTCENTNTPLPYIDLVNETLEHYVAHNLSITSYEGHSTPNGVAPDELLAEPQNVIDSAYELLAGLPEPDGSLPASFPPAPPLPFHRPLEHLRRYFNRLDAPLPLVMESLRVDDRLDRPKAARSSDYRWADILAEELCLSRAERRLLTDSAIPLPRLYGYPADMTLEDAVTELSSAKTFARRMGISYAELFEILGTRFVNPSVALIPKADDLKVSMATLKTLKDRDDLADKEWLEQFQHRLPDKSQYGGNIRTWLKNSWPCLAKIVTLATPILPRKSAQRYRLGDCVVPAQPKSPGIFYECTQAGMAGEGPDSELSWSAAVGKSFEDGEVIWTCRAGTGDCEIQRLRLRYADPEDIAKPIATIELIRLFRFVRLWRKLGWTVQQTDKAIAALYPPDSKDGDDAGESAENRLDRGFETLLLRLGAVKRIMAHLKLKPATDLLPLLACFGPIDTLGIDSLYRQMFPAVLRSQVPAFEDNGYGEFLVDDSRDLTLHGETLRAAFQVSDSELAAILAVVPVRAAVPKLPLTLANVSAVFRRAWLARKLKLSVSELLALIELSGIDPFVEPVKVHREMAQAEEKTRVELPMLRLLRFIDRLRELSVKPVQALYLVWNRDIGGTSAPKDGQILALARSLRTALVAIEDELSLRDDPQGETARSRMALVYGKDAADLFFSLLDRSLLTSVDYQRDTVSREVRVPYTRGPFDPVTHVTCSAPLTPVDEALIQVGSALGKLFYDGQTKRLSFHGILSLELRDELKDENLDLSEGFKAAIDALYIKYQEIDYARMPQAIVDAAGGVIVYHEDSKALSFSGPMLEGARAALRVAADQDRKLAYAIDRLYEESRRVAAASLEQLIADAVPDRIFFDEMRKELSFAGLLTEELAQRLRDSGNDLWPPAPGAAAGTAPECQAFWNATKRLLEASRKTVEPLFRRYPELESYVLAFEFYRDLASETPYSQDDPDLDEALAAKARGRLLYDPNRDRLFWRGILTGAMASDLEDTEGTKEALKGAIENLRGTSQEKIKDFLAAHPGLSALKEDFSGASDDPERLRSVVLAALLPELKRRRKRQVALEHAAAIAGASVDLAAILIGGPSDPKESARYPIHAVNDRDRPGMDDLIAIERTGLAAARGTRKNDALDTGDNAVTEVDAEDLGLVSAKVGDVPIIQCGQWSGFLEAPESGFYRIYIECNAEASVTLKLGDADVLFPANDAGHPRTNDKAIELSAGTLYPFTLAFDKLTSSLQVRWETKSRGQEPIPSRYLYSETLIERLREIAIRFMKGAALAECLKLSPADMAFLGTHPDYRIDPQGGLASGGKGEDWLNLLRTKGEPPRTQAATLFGILSALLDFARIKAALAPGDDRFLAVLKNPQLRTPEDNSQLLALTRWESSSLEALLDRLGKSANGTEALKSLGTFARVYDAYAWLKKLGIGASALIAGATNEPTADAVRALQSALRARYAIADWREIAKPINDELRRLQRDALVAFVLHHLRASTDPYEASIDTPDKLFEHLLMDVQMDPCMETSRVRHALSSVQLFIERCLLGLEAEVPPESIDAGEGGRRWEWMKRYRVWEANRKVFLWPENWLDVAPDDCSPFFKEAMSELLQGDITDERAQTTLLNYLAKLDRVARLEPCGIYYEEPTPGRPHEIVHAVARTAGATRTYYYRRYDGISWTAWEQIAADIEDNPVVPVVWKGRLFLFWLRILTDVVSGPRHTRSGGDTKRPIKSEPPTLASRTPAALKQEVKDSESTAPELKAVLCWSEYYNGAWQPTRTSDICNPISVHTQDTPTSAAPFDRSKMRLTVSGESGYLRVIVSMGLTTRGESFLLRNSQSLPERAQSPDALDEWVAAGDKTLTVGKAPVLSVSAPSLSGVSSPEYRSVEPRHTLDDIGSTAFFYQGAEHVFYVKTSGAVRPIDEHPGIGLQPTLPPKEVEIPPFKVQPPPVQDELRDRFALSVAAYAGVADPGAFAKLNPAAQGMQAIIQSPGTVRFGDKEVGPLGALLTEK